MTTELIEDEKTPPKTPQEMNRWTETVVDDARLRFADGMHIRTIAERISPAEILVKGLYFEGLDVLRCYEGRYRFVVGEHAPVTIGKDEVFITYPGQHVTIEALEPTNRLVYGIFNGANVEDYFNSLGFFDGLRGKTTPQYENVQTLRHMLELQNGASSEHRRTCIAFLTDILASIIHDVRVHGNAMVFDAVWQIRENVRNRIVRIGPLCEQLKISRVHLSRIFSKAGLGTPAEMIRDEQLRLALQLLEDPSKSISDVAEEAGFISTCHFATFIRRMTGKPPSEHRKRR